MNVGCPDRRDRPHPESLVEREAHPTQPPPFWCRRGRWCLGRRGLENHPPGRLRPRGRQGWPPHASRRPSPGLRPHGSTRWIPHPPPHRTRRAPPRCAPTSAPWPRPAVPSARAALDRLRAAERRTRRRRAVAAAAGVHRPARRPPAAASDRPLQLGLPRPTRCCPDTSPMRWSRADQRDRQRTGHREATRARDPDRRQLGQLASSTRCGGTSGSSTAARVRVDSGSLLTYEGVADDNGAYYDPGYWHPPRHARLARTTTSTASATDSRWCPASWTPPEHPFTAEGLERAVVLGLRQPRRPGAGQLPAEISSSASSPRVR